MESEFEHLRRMIDAATSSIAREYFQLPVANAAAMYRERVYCYELYHQLRCVWEGFPLSLGGEIDKSGNPHFENGPYARAKPDLLVHTPGGINNNLAAVEVKPVTADLGDIRDDIRKLTWFCQKARYFRGVFLVYGEGGEPETLSDKLRRAADTGIEFMLLECLYHRHVGERAQRIHP